MQQRRVTAPDGTKWIVGRCWLLHRPRYFGYRFGREKREPAFEVAAPMKVRRKPAPTPEPTPPPVRYTTGASRSRRSRGSGSHRVWWSPHGSSAGRSTGTGGSRSSGGGGLLRSSGGGSRSRSSGGGSRSRSSGGGKRGGGGGGGAAAGGLLTAILRVLLQALKYLLIAAAVIAVTLFVVFVAVPALVFIAHYLAFWIVVGLTIVYRAMTGRPWIVELEEAYGYRVRSWRVRGWRDSKRVIDEIAGAVLAGEDPEPAGAEEVEIENA